MSKNKNFEYLGSGFQIQLLNQIILDKDFSRSPSYKWRIPIGLMKGIMHLFIYKDENRGTYNTRNMKGYEI